MEYPSTTYEGLFHGVICMSSKFDRVSMLLYFVCDPDIRCMPDDVIVQQILYQSSNNRISYIFFFYFNIPLSKYPG